MAKLYQITIRWAEVPTGDAKAQLIETKLGPLGNWLRFSSWTWLLSSDYNSIQIREAIRTVVMPTDYFLVLEVARTQADGWALPWVWDWIRSKQG